MEKQGIAFAKENVLWKAEKLLYSLAFRLSKAVITFARKTFNYRPLKHLTFSKRVLQLKVSFQRKEIC